MKKCVLLSINPRFAKAIFLGEKKFEFRKILFKENVSEIFVYATAPISRVIGKFTIDSIYKDTPELIWERTKINAGINKKEFDLYFQNKKYAIAIKIANVEAFDTPVPLNVFLPSNVPPQSFCYININDE